MISNDVTIIFISLYHVSITFGKTPKAPRRWDHLEAIQKSTNNQTFPNNQHTVINNRGGLLMKSEMDWEEGWEPFMATRHTKA